MRYFFMLIVEGPNHGYLLVITSTPKLFDLWWSVVSFAIWFVLTNFELTYVERRLSSFGQRFGVLADYKVLTIG